MVVFPNAKINLGLRVIEKRRDGYHNIETLFIPVDLCDILEFIPDPTGNSHITITGAKLDGKSGDNLVIKAWSLMHEKYGIPSVQVHLHKAIPVGAGLGGGSADAAFMLKALNTYFQCGSSISGLEELAAELGSDCAFFIQNKPALGTQRGEVLTPVSLSLEKYEILLVNPGIHISSGEAYAGIVPANPDHDALPELIKQPISEWEHLVINDFERTVFKKYPELKTLKEEISKLGAVYASMTGSGSSIFGIFEAGQLAELTYDFGNWFTHRGKLAGELA